MDFSRIVFAAMWTAAATLACTTGAWSAKRVALVIGNGEYRSLTPLANPGADAERMAGLLAANGFEVMSCGDSRPGCHDLTRAELLDALDDFSRLSRDADVALAFYAGHGMQTDSGNVLAPTDIEVDCSDWSAKREVLLDDVLEAMEGAGEKIVILDACRNDPFKAQQCLNRGVRPLSFGSFAVPGQPSRFLLVSSTQSGQLAQDGLPGAHSPFAESLFHFMEAEPRIGFDQLFNRTAKRVIEVTAAQNFTQIPEMLIRGGAPESCLSADGCGADANSADLSRRLDALVRDNARNQEYERIVVALLQSGGLDERTISAEDRQRFFTTVMAAARDLAGKGNSGEQALASLERGDTDEAEQLLLHDMAASQNDPTTEPAVMARPFLSLAALSWAKGESDKAEQLYREALSFDPANLAGWTHLGELLIATGRNAEARAAYESGRDVSERGGSEDRVWILEGLADTWWSDDPAQALAIYREANALATSLAANDPSNTGLRRGQVVTHYNIGHLLMDEGKTTEAIEHFEAGLAISGRLAAEFPSDLRWQYDVSRGHERVGRALLRANDLPAAQSAFLRKQAIAERIARSGEGTYVQDAALADEFLADVAERTGDRQTAATRYQSSLDRMRALSGSAPAHAGYRRWMSVTLLALGDVRLDMGEVDAAFAAFDEAAGISKALVDSDRRNRQWRWDLFRAYQRLATARPPGVPYHAGALEVIEGLKADGMLDQSDETWIATTRDRLENARKMGSKQPE